VKVRVPVGSLIAPMTNEPVVVVVIATVDDVPVVALFVAVAAPVWLAAHPDSVNGSMCRPPPPDPHPAVVTVTVMEPGEVAK
jgi:hypothetical protein